MHPCTSVRAKPLSLFKSISCVLISHFSIRLATHENAIRPLFPLGKKKVLWHSSRADRIARNYLFAMEHECHRTDRKLQTLPSTRLIARTTSTPIEQSHSLQFPKFIRKRDFIHASCVRSLSSLTTHSTIMAPTPVEFFMLPSGFVVIVVVAFGHLCNEIACFGTDFYYYKRM